MRFVAAGKATFTLLNHKTNKHYTYQVKKDDSGKKIWYVSLLVQADNEKGYGYIGMIVEGEFKRTKGSIIGEESPGFSLFDWLFLQMIRGQELPEHVEFMHSGRCGRCGRRLTTPRSLETGLGPVCENR